MKLVDIENAINQNQFLDMWNNFNTKKTTNITHLKKWGHLESTFWKMCTKTYHKKKNLIISDQCIIKRKNSCLKKPIDHTDRISPGQRTSLWSRQNYK